MTVLLFSAARERLEPRTSLQCLRDIKLRAIGIGSRLGTHSVIGSVLPDAPGQADPSLIFVYRMKKPNDARNMTTVAAHPVINIGSGRVRRPMIRPFIAITIITAINGAASTPFTTALQ